MIWPGLLKLGKELQLKRLDAEVVGMVKNCFVKIYGGQNMKVLELFVPEISDLDKEYIIKRLHEGGIKKQTWLEYGIKIIFYEYFLPYPLKKIKGIIFDICSYFLEKYPDQKIRCQKCGVPNDLEAYSYGSAAMAVCGECQKLSESEIEARNAENKFVPDNYAAGFIGSLLYSIPGIFATIFLFVFLNMLAAISSVLYVFLGIRGYKKFKGKISRFGAFLIILSTMLMVGFGIILAYSVLILKEMGTFDIDMLLYILRIPEVQQEMVKNIMVSYAISGIYLVFQLIQMMKEWRSDITVNKAREI
ncbi:MAG: hypothetical protein FWG27_04360 [Treponema sp.]|nr:hypothetical protein [Treponema sp.]